MRSAPLILIAVSEVHGTSNRFVPWNPTLDTACTLPSAKHNITNLAVRTIYPLQRNIRPYHVQPGTELYPIETQLAVATQKRLWELFSGIHAYKIADVRIPREWNHGRARSDHTVKSRSGYALTAFFVRTNQDFRSG